MYLKRKASAPAYDQENKMSMCKYFYVNYSWCSQQLSFVFFLLDFFCCFGLSGTFGLIKYSYGFHKIWE